MQHTKMKLGISATMILTLTSVSSTASQTPDTHQDTVSTHIPVTQQIPQPTHTDDMVALPTHAPYDNPTLQNIATTHHEQNPIHTSDVRVEFTNYQQELEQTRRNQLQTYNESTMQSYKRLHTASNLSGAASVLTQIVVSVMLGASVAYPSEQMTLAALTVSGAGIGLGRLAVYLKKASQKKIKHINDIYRSQGLQPLIPEATLPEIMNATQNALNRPVNLPSHNMGTLHIPYP